MLILKPLIFAIAMHTVLGADYDPPRPGMVPLVYGVSVYVTAQHHGMDPVEAGAVLLAENKARTYDPQQVGRYGKGGEAGLFQLVPLWGALASKRCNAVKRSKHRHYAGMGDCLWIDPDELVLARQDVPGYLKRRGRVSLFRPHINIEAAMIAFLELKRWRAKYAPKVHDWQVFFRCDPDSVNHVQAKATRTCVASVKRVLEWQRRLDARYQALWRYFDGGGDSERIAHDQRDGDG